MKKLYFLVQFLMIANFAFTQNERAHLSNVEVFMEQSGRFVTDLEDAGHIGKINIQIVHSINNNTAKISGVMLSYEPTSGVSVKKYLDKDELGSLLMIMKDLKENIFPNPPPDSSALKLEHYFHSRAGIKIGGFATLTPTYPFKPAWNLFVMLSERSEDKIIISLEDFGKLMKILADAKTKLDGK